MLKKYLKYGALVLIIMITAISLTACGKDDVKSEEGNKVKEEKVEEENIEVEEGTAKLEEEARSEGLEKLLEGDFSYIAGVWENEEGNTVTISNDGGFTYKSGWVYTSSIPKKGNDGSYYWSIGIPGEQVGGAKAAIYLVGSEIETDDNKPTDTTKIRLFTGQGVPTASEIYYKQ